MNSFKRVIVTIIIELWIAYYYLILSLILKSLKIYFVIQNFEWTMKNVLQFL